MCVYSTIMEYGLRRVAPERWTPGAMDAFERMLREAKRFDKAAKQPHCEDPAKADLIADLRKRIEKLEAKQAKARNRRKAARGA